MANIPLQYPFPYKTINSTGFTSSVEFVNVTVLGDVTIDQNLTVSGNITTTDLTVGDDLTVGGQIDAQVLRAFGVWDTPIQTVNGAGAWIGFDGSGHTIFANRKSTAGQTNSWRWYAFDHTNAFQGELMRLSNAGNLFISGTRLEFPLIHFHQPPGTFPNYDFYLPSSMGSAGQVLTSAGVGLPTYWTTPSGGGGGGGTVTNVTGTSPVTVTSPSTTPNISLTTIPTTLGGTGLTTIGTNGQVLSSNGTTLQYITLPTPVTSVAATSPLASSGGATPTISISLSTGTGSVVLANSPILSTQITIGAPVSGQGYLSIISVSNANYIQSGLTGALNSAAPLLFTTTSAGTEWARFTDTGNFYIGTASPPISGTKLFVNSDYQPFATNGINGNYWGFYMSGVRKMYIGIPDTSNDTWITNEHATGHVYLTTTNTSGRIRSVRPILLEESTLLERIPAPDVGLNVMGRIQSTGISPDVGVVQIKSGVNTNYFFTNGTSLQLDTFGSFITNHLTSGAYSRVAAFLAPNNTGTRVYIDLGKSATQNNGGLLSYDAMGTTSSRFALAHHGIGAELFYYQNGNLTIPGSMGINVGSPTAKLDVLTTLGTTTARLKGAPEALILDGTDYVFVRFAFAGLNKAYIGYGNSGNTDFDINSAIGDVVLYNNSIRTMTLKATTGFVGIGTNTPAQKLHVNDGRLRISSTGVNDSVIEVFSSSYSNYMYTKAADGHLIFDVSSRNIGIGTTNPSFKLHVNGTVRGTNFTTNGTTFTYDHGNFTPRLMAYRRPTGLAYELSGSLPGPCSITASYSVQTGRYVRVGQNLTLNIEIRWTISTSGVGPDDYDIFVWIPDGFNPNAIAVAGPCLNFPNTIGGITNPMGILAQYPSFNAGGNVCGLFPTTGTGQIAYPIFAPGGTQILQFAMTYVVN